MNINTLELTLSKLPYGIRGYMAFLGNKAIECYHSKNWDKMLYYSKMFKVYEKILRVGDALTDARVKDANYGLN